MNTQLRSILRATTLTTASFALLTLGSTAAMASQGGTAEVDVTARCTSVDVSSTKDLSNVVLRFTDGATQRFEGLSGHNASFTGTGSNAGDVIQTVWVKSGNNKSDDGPGYGERFDLNTSGCEDQSTTEDHSKQDDKDATDGGTTGTDDETTDRPQSRDEGDDDGNDTGSTEDKHSEGPTSTDDREDEADSSDASTGTTPPTGTTKTDSTTEHGDVETDDEDGKDETKRHEKDTPRDDTSSDAPTTGSSDDKAPTHSSEDGTDEETDRSEDDATAGSVTATDDTAGDMNVSSNDGSDNGTANGETQVLSNGLDREADTAADDEGTLGSTAKDTTSAGTQVLGASLTAADAADVATALPVAGANTMIAALLALLTLLLGGVLLRRTHTA